MATPEGSLIYIVKHYYIVRREIENSPRNALLLRIVGNLLQVKQTKVFSVSFVDRKKPQWLFYAGVLYHFSGHFQITPFHGSIHRIIWGNIFAASVILVGQPAESLLKNTFATIAVLRPFKG